MSKYLLWKRRDVVMFHTIFWSTCTWSDRCLMIPVLNLVKLMQIKISEQPSFLTYNFCGHVHTTVYLFPRLRETNWCFLIGMKSIWSNNCYDKGRLYFFPAAKWLKCKLVICTFQVGETCKTAAEVKTAL